MDKQSTLGFILIAIVLMVWMWYSRPEPTPQGQQAQTSVVADSAKVKTPSPKATTAVRKEKSEPATSAGRDTLGKFFSNAVGGKEKILLLETDFYKAEISSRGGVIKKWEMKGFVTWDQFPVYVVDPATGGDFSLLFTTTDGKLINTRVLDFEVPYSSYEKVRLTGEEEYTIDLTLKAGSGWITKRLTFKNGKHGFDATTKLNRLEDVIANYEYQVIWEHSPRYTEHNSIDESRSAQAYSLAGGELTEIDAANPEEMPVSNTTGQTDWVAARNKYFAVAILSNDKKANGAYIEGKHEVTADQGAAEKYSIGLKIPYKAEAEEEANFSVFLGPLDYDLVKGYERDLQNILSLGWTWLRPLNLYIFIPLFRFLHLFIPNYGLVIILFSIIIKVALNPLTKSSMKSMKKMQALQPMIEELRVKYKDNPQKMNEQVMKLYKDYGANPASGCLPLLLQLPILYALYTLFTTSIDLRQANFFWWITDLSIPDVIVNLPFTVPFFGLRDLSGLALLMGLTTFIQQKMSTKDPRQKAMIWIMPVMLTLLFNSFPSGLNLYYFVFNLLAIGQQILMNRKPEEAPQKVPEKKRSGGIMNRLSKNLPKMPKR
jgi:YidC/Oxa1 family membrane protein insertase